MMAVNFLLEFLLCCAGLCSYWLATCSFHSFVDSSGIDTVERHLQCTQSPIPIVESVALSGNSR